MKPVNLEVTMMKIIGELKAERVHNLNQIGGLQEENARLQAEVERLTKAGDKLSEIIDPTDFEWRERIRDWNAAKEGETK